MGIKIKTDLVWGQAIYLKTDSEQFKHQLVAVVLVPGGEPDKIQVKFKVSYMGNIDEVFDFECTFIPSETLEPDDED